MDIPTIPQASTFSDQLDPLRKSGVIAYVTYTL